MFLKACENSGIEEIRQEKEVWPTNNVRDVTDVTEVRQKEESIKVHICAMRERPNRLRGAI